MDIDAEIESARTITERFNPDGIDPESPESVEQLVQEELPEISSLESDQAIAEVFGMAALHPSAHVRYYMQEAAAELIGNVFAQEYLIDMSHDDEDYVAFQAIRWLGELNVQRSIDDLLSLIGWPSERIREPKGKVGVGGATVLRAQLDIFGSENLEELEAVEQYYRDNGHLPRDRLAKPHPTVCIEPNEPDESLDGQLPADDPPEGMVAVPGGTYTVGIDLSELPVNRFRADDFTVPYTVETEPFFIDRYPVTAAEYDAFVEEVEATDHKYCHPGEPKDKDHRRNTLHDDRIGPNHPATGIDWYDAYAYANWAGKDLPVEEEWEIAARGSAGNIFPWGDEWDPQKLNWAGNSFGVEIDDWNDWRAALETADRMAGIPETITTPVDAFPEGASEFGVVDMLGNVWEYTKTNYHKRQELYPVFKHGNRPAHEHLIGDLNPFPTTRGGAWSSIPEMTSAVYRSTDLMTDRHNEIGFRCVKRPHT